MARAWFIVTQAKSSTKNFYFQNGMAMIIPGQLDNLFPMKNCFLETKKRAEPPKNILRRVTFCVCLSCCKLKLSLLIFRIMWHTCENVSVCWYFVYKMFLPRLLLDSLFSVISLRDENICNSKRQWNFLWVGDIRGKQELEGRHTQTARYFYKKSSSSSRDGALKTNEKVSFFLQKMKNKFKSVTNARVETSLFSHKFPLKLF